MFESEFQIGNSGDEQNQAIPAKFQRLVESRFPGIARHFRRWPDLVRELDERLGSEN